MRRESLLLTIVLLTVFAISSIAVVPTQAAEAALPKVTIIAPGNANIVRRQWGQIIANSLTTLGFDARLVFLGWAAVYDRVLTPLPANVGKTYDQGGYDVQLLGWTPGLIANPRALFLGDPGFFAPTGQNYYLYNNTKSNELLNLFVTTTNDTVRAQALQDWQWLYYNDNPSSQLLYEKNVAAISPKVVGYDWIYFNVAGTPQWLKKAGTSNDNVLIYATTGEITSLIPPTSNSWYDTIILSVIHSGLLEVNNAREPINGLMTSYNTSSDGHTWTLNLRQNVQWHTGVTFNADDVLYTLMSFMNSLAGSQFVGYYADILGQNVDFKWLHETTTKVYYNGSQTVFNPSTVPSGTRQGNVSALDANTVQLYLPNISGLTKPYGFFGVETLLGNNLIPKHVLEKIPYDQWSTSPVNTGTGTLTIQLPNGTDYTLKGPIGTGPYMFEGYDVTAQQVHMRKFNNFWNRTGLEAVGQFAITDYYIKYIADKTPALAALKNGEVDMLDPNYHMQKDVPTIEPSWGVVLDLVGAGRQEMGFNMKHPIWGTGTGTPLGTAEAARHLRLAVDYAIPRQLIIDNLLDGYGTPGVTPCLPTQLYYNASIPVRPYDLVKAKQELALAGYGTATTPTSQSSFILGSSARLTGTWTDSDGAPLPDTTLEVRQSSDNETYSIYETVKTDGFGRWVTTITPSKTGPMYISLADPTQPGYSGVPIGFFNVTTLSNVIQSTATTPLTNQMNTLQNNLSSQITALQTQNNYLIIGIVVAIIAAIAAIFMGRRG